MGVVHHPSVDNWQYSCNYMDAAGIARRSTYTVGSAHNHLHSMAKFIQVHWSNLWQKLAVVAASLDEKFTPVCTGHNLTINLAKSIYKQFELILPYADLHAIAHHFAGLWLD